MSHWMQLMEVRSAKLPRGFSACGVGRKPSRRRQWPSIPFPSSPPHPVSSFPTAAVSHSLHLSDSLDLRERIVRRWWWWFEVAIEKGTGGGGCAALIPAARFRSQFSRALTRLLSPPTSTPVVLLFLFYRVSGFLRSPTSSLLVEEDCCWKEAQKIQPLTDRRIVFARRMRGEKWSEKRRKMKRGEGGLRFRIPGLDWFESITIRFWASIAWRSTIRWYVDSCRHIIVLYIMFRIAAFYCPFRWIYQILWREKRTNITACCMAYSDRYRGSDEMIKGKAKLSFCSLRFQNNLFQFMI